MGNSEVGHNIMGAGRVFDQGAKQVEEAIKDGLIWGAPWQQVVGRSRVHFIGLLSDGNVHSHIRHLITMLRHAAADGVDAARGAPIVRRARRHRSIGRAVPRRTRGSAGRHPRAVRMRRRGRFGRRANGHHHGPLRGRLVHRAARGTARTSPAPPAPFTSAAEALATLRKEQPGVSDQFLPEFTVVDADGTPVGAMHSGDAVVLFNFRGDRMIEIYRALTEEPFAHFGRGPASGRPPRRRPHHVRRRPGHTCHLSGAAGEGGGHRVRTHRQRRPAPGGRRRDTEVRARHLLLERQPQRQVRRRIGGLRRDPLRPRAVRAEAVDEERRDRR